MSLGNDDNMTIGDDCLCDDTGSRSAARAPEAHCHLHDPWWQRDVTAPVSHIAASSMEAHDCLHLQPMLPGFLEQLHIGFEVILLGSMPLTDAPPGWQQQVCESPSSNTQKQCSAVHLTQQSGKQVSAPDIQHDAMRASFGQRGKLPAQQLSIVGRCMYEGGLLPCMSVDLR